MNRLTVLCIAICINSAGNNLSAQCTFDIEGHRGCRGILPENTIPAFVKATMMGVSTLEMDVVVSADGQLVVSHDPYMSDEICNTPDGKAIPASDKNKYKIFDMKYAEIQKFDCGSRGNIKFPDQQKMPVAKPRLVDVIDSIEKLISSQHLPQIQYNIETKSDTDGDDIKHPKPAIFSKLLYDLLKEKNVLHKCIIQSFDPRTLQAMHATDSTIRTALLVFNTNGLEKNLAGLNFLPTIYSPNFLLVNKRLIRQCHQSKIKIIPWTVNDPDKMKSLKAMGVDGLITDFPDRALKVLRAK